MVSKNSVEFQRENYKKKINFFPIKNRISNNIIGNYNIFLFICIYISKVYGFLVSLIKSIWIIFFKAFFYKFVFKKIYLKKIGQIKWLSTVSTVLPNNIKVAASYLKNLSGPKRLLLPNNIA